MTLTKMLLSSLSLLMFCGHTYAANNTTASNTTSTTAASSAAELKVDTGDTAWMLTSTALVMFMTPGLAFFYGGLVRSQNSLNTLLMNFSALGLITVHWIIFGYTFAFGPGTKGFGSFKWVGFRDVGYEPNGDYAPTIPHILFAVYQMTFAIITPAIISGAVVERMSFRTYLIFMTIWTTVVYDAIAHWVWGSWTDGNGTTYSGWIKGIGAIDFAGGTVVHMSSGFSALAASFIVGKRKTGAPSPPVPHNIPFVLLGVAILWFGWFGFNGGSALGSNALAALAFTNTQIATGMAMLTWMIMDSVVKKKFTAAGAASGAVVGLVAITPAAGYVHPASSIAFGGITVLCVYGAIEMKQKWFARIFPQSDDTLDVFTCHGVGGLVGCLLLGFFSSSNANSSAPNGVFFGGSVLLGYQISAILITFMYSVGATVIILLILKYTIGLTSDDCNDMGLDYVEHGQKAYVYDDDIHKKCYKDMERMSSGAALVTSTSSLSSSTSSLTLPPTSLAQRDVELKAMKE